MSNLFSWALMRPNDFRQAECYAKVGSADNFSLHFFNLFRCHNYRMKKPWRMIPCIHPIWVLLYEMGDYSGCVKTISRSWKILSSISHSALPLKLSIGIAKALAQGVRNGCISSDMLKNYAQVIGQPSWRLSHSNNPQVPLKDFWNMFACERIETHQWGTWRS